MPGADEFLFAIEAIYTAGLEAKLWPQALAGVMQCVGGIAATLEIYNRAPINLVEFHSIGIPPMNEVAYVADFSALNPRVPVLLSQQSGELTWDYMVKDEQQMKRDPFYSDFLAPARFRYFIGATLTPTEQEHTLFSVQRSIKQGHIDKSHMAAMRRFMPHMQRAVDMARRLRGFAGARHSLERALDWLADGVALLRADNKAVYVNETLQRILRGDDGIRMRNGFIEFHTANAEGHFSTALKSVRRVRDDPQNTVADFASPRPSGNPPYIVSVRPLLVGDGLKRSDKTADAIIFIRDPLAQNIAAIQVLREAFGLTAAEANIAQALQLGIPLDDYARKKSVTINTVYTHLRRIKEKIGSSRMPELIRKLNDVQLPLRTK